MAEKQCRRFYGYNIISVIIAGLGIAVLDILLFISVDSKQKYKLYRGQILIIMEILCYFLYRNIWKECSCFCSSQLNIDKLWKFVLGILLSLMFIGPFYTFIVTKEPSLMGMMAWSSFGGGLLLCLLIWFIEGFVILLRLLKLGNSLCARICCSQYRGAICILFTALYCWIGYVNGTSPPTIVRHTIPVAKLPSSMNGLKIALLCDIHLGPTVGFSMMENAVKITNSIKPDIVVLAGDLTDGTLEELREAALPLKNLVAPMGAFFVTGNHEYYTSDVENWLEFLESVGFHILHNSNYKVRSQKKTEEWFCMFGTDDHQADILSYEGHTVNLTKAYTGCDRKHAAILVTHQPNVVKKALDAKIPFQLALSGHTHGGQFFPFSIPVYLASAFFSGLYKYDSTTYVYVSQGTYYYGWPFRIGSTSEITDITLISA